MARELLTAWLNDTYAMERGLIRILENHASDPTSNVPVVPAGGP